MLIQDRIRLILKANNLSSAEFCDRIGVKRSNLSHVLNGRNKPGLDFLSKIINTFPNVNAAWLLTGQVVENELTGEYQAALTNDSSEVASETEVSAAFTDSEIEHIIVFYKNGTCKRYTLMTDNA